MSFSKTIITLALLFGFINNIHSEKRIFADSGLFKRVAEGNIIDLDYNGDPLAVLIIKSPIPNLMFTGSAIYEYKQNEDDSYIIYLLDGCQGIEISADGYLPYNLDFNFRIKGGNEYYQYVDVIDSYGNLKIYLDDNQLYDVYIDHEYAGKTPFEAQIPTGLHNISLLLPNSLEEIFSQQIEISDNSTTEINNSLIKKEKTSLINIITDPNALVLVDNKPINQTNSYSSNKLNKTSHISSYELEKGIHDIIVIKPYQFFRKNTTYIDTIGNMKRINVKNDVSSFAIPLAGSLTLIKTSTDYPNLNIKITPKDDNYTQTYGAILPDLKYANLNNTIYPLRGSYELMITADGYITKKKDIFINPGDETTYTIKLDRDKPYIFILYSAGIIPILGVELAACGKYYGWYAKLAGLSLNKGEGALGAETGPMFTVLRARTWVYLQLGAGFYIKPDYGGWSANVSFVFRLPRSFTFKVGYSYPFGADRDKTWNFQNILFGFGKAF